MQHEYLLIPHEHNSGPVNIHICVFIVFFPVFGNIRVLLVIINRNSTVFRGIYIM